MRVHETFESICGEGPVIGTPALFIRLYGCNLNCDFCDTRQEKFEEFEVDNIINTIAERGISVVCWTGGEPTTQLNEMLQVIDGLEKRNCVYDHIVETNGTIINIDIVKANMDKISIWIVSPKDKKTARYWINALKANEKFVNKVYLKFVVDNLNELPSELENLHFFVQPKLRPNQDPVQAFKDLSAQLWESIMQFPRMVILPQLHKIMGVK